jgi:hypothetical protein|tara:strand:+ start:633 stop:845 length:213 start_codon:yes stop_codon:yes gene_type:complete
MKHVYLGMDYDDKIVVGVKPTKRGNREFPATQLTLDDGSVVFDGEQWGVGEATVIQREELSTMLPFVGGA